MSNGKRVFSDDIVSEIRTRYATGKVSQRKLSLEYGVDPSTINQLLQNKLYYDKNYVYKKRVIKTSSRRKMVEVTGSKASEKQKEAFLNQFVNKTKDILHLVSYVGGYENEYSNVTMKCDLCDTETVRRVSTVKQWRSGRTGLVCLGCDYHHKAIDREQICVSCNKVNTTKSVTNIMCNKCISKVNKNNIKQIKNIRKLLSQEIAAIKNKQREVRKELYSNRWTSKVGNIYPKINECSRCNNDFYYDTHSKRNVCDECIRVTQRANEYKRDIVRQNRMKQNGRYDETINLDKVIERYHNVCYICKEECDRNDFEWKSGVFYTGKNYPTIEHVVPISKGGTHTWCNVNLACMHCNAIKGNN